MKTKLKTNKGITLIVLVIIIIVLLILAGVSISMLTGDKGMIKKATESKKSTEQAVAKEAVEVEVLGSLVNNGTYDKNKVKEKLKDNLNISSSDIKDNLDGSLDVKYKGIDLVVKTDGEVIYKVVLDCTPNTTPFLPDGAIVTNNDLNTGLTIKDDKGNEWVWIEVPKSIYNNTTYNNNGANKPTGSTDYSKIEAVMNKYTETYKSGTRFKDIWYAEDNGTMITEETQDLTLEQKSLKNGCGLTYDEYINKRQDMLKSVYENGGFYIGKYEVGIMDSYRTRRIDLNVEPTETPVIKEGAYPYNYVTNKQAQQKTIELSTGGRTSSLMFGVQWDLVLKHIEVKRTKLEGEAKLVDIQKDLNINSSSWGNYNDASFNIDRGKYSENYGKNFTTVLGIFNKRLYNESEIGALLTTGATERNSILNIYDLAGNVWEWTLEYTSHIDRQCASRGGNYGNYGSSFPSSVHGSYSATTLHHYLGFRSALY